ncbi:hypothetical protein, partial [Acidiphilium sp.]|uniref:hypothetical protein n=1 Tax=Acidiphilium sp. TaxID=527 RepID=UPI00258DFF9E
MIVEKQEADHVSPFRQTLTTHLYLRNLVAVTYWFEEEKVFSSLITARPFQSSLVSRECATKSGS